MVLLVLSQFFTGDQPVAEGYCWPPPPAWGSASA
jgi:hypothetical protein